MDGSNEQLRRLAGRAHPAEQVRHRIGRQRPDFTAFFSIKSCVGKLAFPTELSLLICHASRRGSRRVCHKISQIRPLKVRWPILAFISRALKAWRGLSTPRTRVAQKEDVVMRHTFDMTPFTRSGIGFERLLHQLDSISQPDPDDNYPPYNIEKMGEDRYRVSLAVAGFAETELSITAEGNVLTVSGKRAEPDKPGGMLHRGIASRSFIRRFSLAEHVVVKDVQLSNGLLIIDLERQVPEAMKPRRIPIGGGTAVLSDSKKAA
jgi:molecular chaperone IbpA